MFVRNLGVLGVPATSKTAAGPRTSPNEMGEREPMAGNENGGPLRFVQQNPLTSVMTGFGLGLGFGLAVTLLMTRRELSWYERNISEPFQHLPDRLKRVPDSVGNYLQASWKHR